MVQCSGNIVVRGRTMSKKPQTMANLREAERVKQSPFKTKIHANPAMKQEIDALLGEGIALRTVHREMKKKYGTAMTSLSTFSSYVKTYYVPQHSVSVPEQGFAALKDFDALQLLRNDIDKLQEMIELFESRETTTKIPSEYVRKYRELRISALEKFITLGIKLGVISGQLAPEVNNYGTVNTGTFIATGEADLLTAKDMIKLDEMIAFQKKVMETAEKYGSLAPDENDPKAAEKYEFSVVQSRPVGIPE
jgi:hypothetical protein